MGLIPLALVVAGCGGGEADSPASGAAFDRAFIDAMVPHHEGAIEMAAAAKDAGLSQPDLVEVADDILATQQQEIDQMKSWRQDWFGSSAIDPKGADALGLSESELGMQHDSSAFAGSGDVDADFARIMIDHHQGAIDMAELAIERAERREIKELAEAIIDVQQIEIEILRPHASGQHHGG